MNFNQLQKEQEELDKKHRKEMSDFLQAKQYNPEKEIPMETEENSRSKL